MTSTTSAPEGDIARGAAVSLRRIAPSDLAQVARFGFTVSILQPLTAPEALAQAHADTGFWGQDAGAVAIIETATGRLLGTSQFYSPGPCVHGYEVGYIIHSPEDRGRGFGAAAVQMFSDHLFETRAACQRLQLMIETWNTPSWRLAERCGYVREGLLRSAGFGERPADCFLYARTRNDWFNARHSPISLGGPQA